MSCKRTARALQQMFTFMARARNLSLVALLAAVSCSACYKRHDAAPPGPSQSQQPKAATDTGGQAPVMAEPPQAAPTARPSGPTPADAGPAPATPRPRIETAPNLKIAFFGDQSMRPEARAVLSLVAREKADAVIHLGDFAYDEAMPEQWEAQIDSALGKNFPYFAVVGNHDVANWAGPNGFAQRLNARLSHMADARCEGEYGVDSICNFRGLHFVLSGIGSYGTDHEPFLHLALSQSPALHRLCIWHKNQHDMQAGGKTDEVGWLAYRICQQHGAPIITGHEHSYARTYSLRAVGAREQGHGAFGQADRLAVGPGRTFVVVSGLGGHSTRVRTPEHATDSWWASMYAADYQLVNGVVRGVSPDIEFGALFVTFNVDDDPTKASAYFKTVSGKIMDQFSWSVER